MSKIVQRSIQIEEEIPQLSSLSRKLLSEDLGEKYHYRERSLKLMIAASKAKPDPYPPSRLSIHEEAIKISSDSDGEE